MLKTLEKGLKVLELFLQTGQKTLSLAEVSRELDLNKTIAFRILQTLKANDFLTQESDKSFRLGTKLFLFQEAINNLWSIKDLAHEEMVRMTRVSNESVFLNILSDDNLHSICIHKVEGEQSIKVSFALGREIPLYAGASSQVILAHLPPQLQERVWEGSIKPFTARTLISPEELKERCREIKEQGYSITEGEVDPGIVALAAPLTGSNGKVIAGLTLACPQHRVDDKRKQELLDLLLASARRINAM